MINQYDIPDLTPEQFAKFAKLIHEEAHITMKEGKITLLSNRLRKRLRALGMNNFDEYYEFILKKNPHAIQEMVHFLEAVTTNESYFWRTTNNYELMKEHLLGGLLERARGRTLNFWSAGSSTGEEPYNLAIELVESMKRFGVFDFKVYASDISSRVVDFAKLGRYSGRKIDKIPPMILNRYFSQVEDEPGTYEVRADIKKRIDFRIENLFRAEVPPMDIIFCRNVMIYFSRADQEKLAHIFYNSLKPGGYLIVGHSESLHMMETPFEARHFPQGVAYWKREGLS